MGIDAVRTQLREAYQQLAAEQKKHRSAQDQLAAAREADAIHAKRVLAKLEANLRGRQEAKGHDLFGAIYRGEKIPGLAGALAKELMSCDREVLVLRVLELAIHEMIQFATRMQRTIQYVHTENTYPFHEES